MIDMRGRNKIEDTVFVISHKTAETQLLKIQIELLLDIRDLLKELKK